jgi:hypothetical protein
MPGWPDLGPRIDCGYIRLERTNDSAFLDLRPQAPGLAVRISVGSPLRARGSKLAAAFYQGIPKICPTRTNILSIRSAQKPL